MSFVTSVTFIFTQVQSRTHVDTVLSGQHMLLSIDACVISILGNRFPMTFEICTNIYMYRNIGFHVAWLSIGKHVLQAVVLQWTWNLESMANGPY